MTDTKLVLSATVTDITYNLDIRRSILYRHIAPRSNVTKHRIRITQTQCHVGCVQNTGVLQTTHSTTHRPSTV